MWFLSFSSAPFYKIMVPTVDTVRYNYLVSTLVANQNPVLLVGPVGTGKTSIAQSVLQSLPSSQWSVLVVNMSAQVRGGEGLGPPVSSLPSSLTWNSSAQLAPYFSQGPLTLIVFFPTRPRQTMCRASLRAEWRRGPRVCMCHLGAKA